MLAALFTSLPRYVQATATTSTTPNDNADILEGKGVFTSIEAFKKNWVKSPY